MRKTFLGVKLKTLREQRGLTQAALAQLLDLSPSYLNQLENNQRPLSVPVLLRLQTCSCSRRTTKRGSRRICRT
jgi:transcriptional regulator with XRE-family HTH domain